jgi:hypothetical protein
MISIPTIVVNPWQEKGKGTCNALAQQAPFTKDRNV